MSNRFIATCAQCHTEIQHDHGTKRNGHWYHKGRCAPVDPFALIEVKGRKRHEHAKAYAWGNGQIGEDGREKWFWLPKSKVHLVNDETVMVPLWLVARTGILDHLRKAA